MQHAQSLNNTGGRKGRTATIAYWVTTGLLALSMTASGIMDLIGGPQILAVITGLGYPPYVATILGAAKLLGVTALLIPRGRFLKEWAYAGFTFDLLGAVVSHAVVQSVATTAAPALMLTLTIASYALWHRHESTVH